MPGEPVPGEAASADPALRGRALGDPVRGDPVRGDPVLDDAVLDDAVLEDPVLEDPVLEDPVLEDRARAPVRRLVLASASPARRRVLVDAGLRPEVVVSGVEEDIGDLPTRRAVLALAERKASTVAGRCLDALVLGCDSMLDVDGQPVGKPASAAAAAEWCRRLSAHRAVLHTGHCLIDTATGRRVTEVDTTVVRFGPLDDSEIDAYVATGEPMSMAGAFSLEGFGAPFVDGVDGSPSNVLGLSMPLLRRMLAELGVRITELWSPDTAGTVGE